MVWEEAWVFLDWLWLLQHEREQANS
jgi:hypothetical protein